VHAITAVLAAIIIASSTLAELVAERLSVPPLSPETHAVVSPEAPRPPDGMRPGAIDSLPGVVDAAARRLMAEQHAPGAALAIVHAGRVLMLRAYGTGNVERGTPVDASRTLFRVGSVTKPLTAAAVLQLVDAGRSICIATSRLSARLHCGE
jgi:CubicO group peptidase (beta-lactamase class C family)